MRCGAARRPCCRAPLWRARGGSGLGGSRSRGRGGGSGGGRGSSCGRAGAMATARVRPAAAAAATARRSGGEAEEAVLDEEEQDAVIFELEANAAAQRRVSMVTAAAVLAIGAGAYALSAVASTLKPLERARDARLGVHSGASAATFVAADVCTAACLLCAAVACALARNEARPPSRTLVLVAGVLAGVVSLFWGALLWQEHTYGLPSPWSLAWLPAAPACACGVVAYLRGELAHTARELAYLKSLRYECKSA